ncbi:GGDEF domain-containing protein [Aeromonas intestinalis]
MLKTPLKLSIHPSRFSSLSRGRRIALMLLPCLLLLTAGWDGLSFALLPQHHLYTIGGMAEIINVLTLLFMFWVVQCATLSRRSYLYLSSGLYLWLVSGAIDVMDEVYFQPWWLSRVEDCLRSLGMLATAWGVLLMVKQMYDTQVRLASLAMSDELTGLSNRRSFSAVLDSQMETGTPLLLLDLDHFKQVNDRHGHGTGDNVLREFSALLRQHCPAEGIVARLGGEEFAIWLPGLAIGKGGELAEQIRAATERLVMTDGIRVTVSVAVGICLEGENAEALVKRTDLALYRAKHLGRNRVELA